MSQIYSPSMVSIAAEGGDGSSGKRERIGNKLQLPIDDVFEGVQHCVSR